MPNAVDDVIQYTYSAAILVRISMDLPEHRNTLENVSAGDPLEYYLQETALFRSLFRLCSISGSACKPLVDPSIPNISVPGDI